MLFLLTPLASEEKGSVGQEEEPGLKFCGLLRKTVRNTGKKEPWKYNEMWGEGRGRGEEKEEEERGEDESETGRNRIYKEGGGKREGGKERTTQGLRKLGWGQHCLATGAAMTSAAAQSLPSG